MAHRMRDLERGGPWHVARVIAQHGMTDPISRLLDVGKRYTFEDALVWAELLCEQHADAVCPDEPYAPVWLKETLSHTPAVMGFQFVTTDGSIVRYHVVRSI